MTKNRRSTPTRLRLLKRAHVWRRAFRACAGANEAWNLVDFRLPGSFFPSFPAWQGNAKVCRPRLSGTPIVQQATGLSGHRRPVTRHPGQTLSRGADCDFLDSAADERLVLCEIRCEAPGQLTRGLVIGLLVGPGAAWIEDLARNIRTAFRHEVTEIGVLPHRRRGEATVERGAQQSARMSDRHPPADPIGAPGPAGVDEPALRTVLLAAR